jgi:hypothetical protein
VVRCSAKCEGGIYRDIVSALAVDPFNKAETKTACFIYAEEGDDEFFVIYPLIIHMILNNAKIFAIRDAVGLLYHFPTLKMFFNQ